MKNIIAALILLITGFYVGRAIYYNPHHWVETHRSYQPGHDNVECSWCTIEVIKELADGVTTIEYTDTVTGETKIERRLGDLR